MKINVFVSEDEIQSNPNLHDLGKLVFERYLDTKKRLNIDEMTIKVATTTCPNCNRDLSNLSENDLDGCGDPNCGKILSEEEYDLCVICHKKSPYLKSTHIDKRIGYVEGVGQTCFIGKYCKENSQNF
jgi:hypothetical protein